jgi:hypothetical protein
MKILPVLPAIRRVPVHWLFEAGLIVIGVALGFWVTQIQEARQNREHAMTVLKGVRAEVEHNRATLEPFVPMHSKWVEALEKADTSISSQSGMDVYFATRPAFPAGAKSPFPFLRRSAWDVALSGGALRLIEYDVAAALSDIYQVQEIATGNVARLANGVLSSATPFDPASRAPSVRLLWLTVADIASAEAALLDLYRQHLPTIRAAADGQR